MKSQKIFLTVRTSPDCRELPEEQTRMRGGGEQSSRAKRQPKDPGPKVLGDEDKSPWFAATIPPNFPDGSRCWSNIC